MEDQRAAKTPPTDSILIIDDDETSCFVLKRTIRKSGFERQIITAHNGIEALYELQAIAATGDKLPELILLNIKMPVMNGLEFLEALTQLTELNLSQIRIYMCTSSTNLKDKEQAHLYPIAGFLTKPVTQEVLNGILA